MRETPLHPNWAMPMRLILARPRFFISALVGVATVWLLAPEFAMHSVTRIRGEESDL